MNIANFLLVLLVVLPWMAQADGAAIVKDRCAACHAITQPDYAGSGIEERLQRQAPPLYYAGNKYRSEWLLSWLQVPTRLYPAGYRIGGAVTTGPDGDMVDDSKLPQHPALDAAEATQVTDYLLTLKPYDALIAQDKYTPGTVAQRMGMMDFRKFKGCNACHQDEPGTGGYSGPELHTAWQRLQPAYISSYITNPVAWDPHTIMPVGKMNEAAAHKLVNYLKLLGGE